MKDTKGIYFGGRTPNLQLKISKSETISYNSRWVSICFYWTAVDKVYELNRTGSHQHNYKGQEMYLPQGSKSRPLVTIQEHRHYILV